MHIQKYKNCKLVEKIELKVKKELELQHSGQKWGDIQVKNCYGYLQLTNQAIRNKTKKILNLINVLQNLQIDDSQVFSKYQDKVI